MEVTRTVPVKLLVPDDRRVDLHATIRQFNDAPTYTVEHGRNDDGYLILNKSTIHDLVYYDLREVTDLPANLSIRSYSTALEAMKSTVADWNDGKRRPLPTVDQPSAVYDKRTLTIRDRRATLSTVTGRVEVEYVLGAYQRAYLDDVEYERRMGTLHYCEDDGAFYLHIVLLEEVEERGGGRVMVVDLNLKNVAVTSTGWFFDGGELLWGQNLFFRVRRSLEAKGTRSAKQALVRLSGRETRFVLDRLHTISRRLVEEAVAHDCSYIAVEDLTHIREQMVNRNDRIKRQMHNWAFRELREMLDWKAAEYGIHVEPVDPAFSSQTCSVCGHQARTNRDSDGWFTCIECGYTVDGDYNAAKNIGMRLLTVSEGERPSGLGDGQLALKSGTVNGSYTPADDSSADRASTDKPTTLVLGR